MEVKIGGTYINGVGEKVGPLVEPYMSGYLGRFKGDDGIDLHFNADGSVFSAGEPSKWDLVSEYPIGKTLTELDVKPGDVVRGVDCTFANENDFTCVEIVPDNPYKGEHTMKSESYGQGIFGNDDGRWQIVSRAPQNTAKPKRMHPDDVATACEQYLRDCGYTMARLDLVTALGAAYSIEPPPRF